MPIGHYRVRESARAKYVRLTLSPREGLVVVVPRRFDRSRVPELVASRVEWISAAAHRLGVSIAEPPIAAHEVQLPKLIELRAVGETWPVEYRDSPGPRTRAVARHRTLTVCAPAGEPAAAAESLRRWLSARARKHLEPSLRALAEERGLHVRSVSVRGQRTRWGSCSPDGSISVNRSLLFLRPEQVRYVLLHELCHLREPNHSARFWSMLGGFEPRSDELKVSLVTAWRDVPVWSETPRR